MSLFNHSLTFQPIDPMADGLGDDIRQEQREAESFDLTEQLDGRLADEWEEILDEARHDPTFTFVGED